MSDYEQSVRRVAEGYERIMTALEEALDQRRLPRIEWRDAVSDTIGELDRIVRRDAHPDDVDAARGALSCLAGVLFSADQIDEIYLGGEEP